MTCTTDWTFEATPGGTGVYDCDASFNDETFDGIPFYYDTTGTETGWFFEEPIDGCLAEEYQFQDGSTFQMQDGSTFEF